MTPVQRYIVAVQQHIITRHGYAECDLNSDEQVLILEQWSKAPVKRSTVDFYLDGAKKRNVRPTDPIEYVNAGIQSAAAMTPADEHPDDTLPTNDEQSALERRKRQAAETHQRTQQRLHEEHVAREKHWQENKDAPENRQAFEDHRRKLQEAGVL